MQEYAKRLEGVVPDDRLIMAGLNRLAALLEPMYHADAFAHPLLPVLKSDMEMEAMRWGLIPAWVKNADEAIKISRQTLNARGESIFEKPAYRQAANQGRCIIIADGFYEYHHLAAKAFPFFIKMQNDEPLLIAGIYTRWVNKETAEEIASVSLVTTSANTLLTKIHNNPKGEGHRMPLILERGEEKKWLNGDKTEVMDLIAPKAEGFLEAWPVNALKGKNACGNIPEATTKADYGIADLEMIMY